MKRLAATLLGLLVTVAIAAGFAFLHIRWNGLSGSRADFALTVLGASTLFCLAAFLAGQWLGLRSMVYYMVVAALLFLAADALIWLELGIMPSAKFVRGGFVPAAILGVFLGPIYRIIAVPDVPPPPRH